jgi:phosphoglucosamine mutase
VARKYFGTDGVRGVANRTLTPEFAFELGQAAGRQLLASDQPHKALIARDPRRSGPMLGASLASGLCSVGIDVTALGVAPTGAVSYLTRNGGYGLGAVISASHNPAPDNGIKLIGSDGRKLSDDDELAIEGMLKTRLENAPEGANVGYLESGVGGVEELSHYVEFLKAIVPETLDGLKVGMDAGNGAAFRVAPIALEALGATLVLAGHEPDGMNINKGVGATSPGTVQQLTVQAGADVGIAFDGDADRAVLSDGKGRLINGDRIMAIWANHWKGSRRMKEPTVVGTVMSNGGFEQYLGTLGLKLERTPVGDKHVAARMRETGAAIGGEQSGHLIFSERGVTGDGLVTALELLRVLRLSGKTAEELFDAYENWPQVLVNVTVERKEGWQENPAVQSAIADSEKELGRHGRVLVRASGTQPMIRVMVEASQADARDRCADRIVDTLLSELGGEVSSKVDLTHALGD